MSKSEALLSVPTIPPIPQSAQARSINRALSGLQRTTPFLGALRSLSVVRRSTFPSTHLLCHQDFDTPPAIRACSWAGPTPHGCSFPPMPVRRGPAISRRLAATSLPGRSLHRLPLQPTTLFSWPPIAESSNQPTAVSLGLCNSSPARERGHQ